MYTLHPYNHNPEKRVRKETLRWITSILKTIPRSEITQKRIKGFVQMIVRDLWDSVWMDVSKQLPPNNGEYLVLAENDGWYELAHYNGTDKKFTLSNLYPGKPLEVKFWSYLPEPPRHVPKKDDLEELNQ